MDFIIPRKGSARSTVSNRRGKSIPRSLPAKITPSAEDAINLPPYGQPAAEITQKVQKQSQREKTIKKRPTPKSAVVSRKDSTKMVNIEGRLELLEKKVEMLENSLKTKTRSMTKRKDTLDSIDRKLMQNSNNIENQHLFPGAIFEAIDANNTKLLGNVLYENSSALNEERNGNRPLEYAVKKGNLLAIKLLVNATPKDQSLDGLINLALQIQDDKEGTDEEFKYAEIYKYLILTRKNRNK
jgi:hypothetical protein